jgi:hypothetical protein|tara:strand:- start:891 stop:1184 length:294 start_codon:yes stop_codon:yes gene_type:complete
MQVSKERPIFNVFHQNSLLNKNIQLVMNQSMAEELIGLVKECCATDDGMENRHEYPHLYGLSDRLQSNIDWTRMQSLRNSRESSQTDKMVKCFLNNI